MSILARLVLWAADHTRRCSVTIAGPAQFARFRLIRFTPKLHRCAQKPHGISSMSARIVQSMFLQMTQIIVQGSVSREGIDMRAEIGNLVFPYTSDGLMNLALAVREIMRDAKRATQPLGKNRTPAAPATSGNSDSNGGASARLNGILYKYSCCTKICV